MQEAIKMLRKDSEDSEQVFKALLGLCQDDLKKLEIIFCYSKLVKGQSMTNCLESMSNDTKESFEWLVTYIKSTKLNVEKPTLKRLEDASNRLSKEHLHRVVGQATDQKLSLEFTERVYVYAKYIILKQMAQ